MNKLIWLAGLCGLALVVQAQEPVPPAATPAEVLAGTDRYKIATPYAIKQAGLTAYPTNGITAATATNIAAYQAQIATNGFVGGGDVTQSGLAAGSYAQPLTTKTLLVRTNGNNSTAVRGKTFPYLTIAAATTAAVVGDVVDIGPGVWQETITNRSGVYFNAQPGCVFSNYNNAVVFWLINSTNGTIRLSGEAVILADFLSFGFSTYQDVVVNARTAHGITQDHTEIFFDAPSTNFYPVIGVGAYSAKIKASFTSNIVVRAHYSHTYAEIAGYVNANYSTNTWIDIEAPSMSVLAHNIDLGATNTTIILRSAGRIDLDGSEVTREKIHIYGGNPFRFSAADGDPQAQYFFIGTTFETFSDTPQIATWAGTFNLVTNREWQTVSQPIYGQAVGSTLQTVPAAGAVLTNYSSSSASSYMSVGTAAGSITNKFSGVYEVSVFVVGENPAATQTYTIRTNLVATQHTITMAASGLGLPMSLQAYISLPANCRVDVYSAGDDCNVTRRNLSVKKL